MNLQKGRQIKSPKENVFKMRLVKDIPVFIYFQPPRDINDG